MPRLRELRGHLDALDDIGQIMKAMRSLAFIEVRRLEDGADARRGATRAIATALADLVTHEPAVLPVAPRTTGLVVALGSERGLCGDFNHAVTEALRTPDGVDPPACLAIGAHLQARLSECGIAHRALPGAAVIEDVPRVLAAAVSAMRIMLEERPGTEPVVDLLFREGDAVRRLALLPCPDLPLEKSWRVPPRRYLPPRDLFGRLIDQYVPAALGEALLESLLAENRQRLDHMSAALDRMHERTDTLHRAYRRARQEAITEEIEIILLGARGTARG